MVFETSHLRLLPFSPNHLVALIEAEEQFEQSFGHRAAPGLRAMFTSAEVSSAWLAQLRASAAVDPWAHGFAVVHRESELVIGSVGFKGPPDEQGVVEIAYGIVPDYRGRGYATQAVKEGVVFAVCGGRMRVVRAHTVATNDASSRVLVKCGFERVGEFVDPDDGRVHRWELREQPT